MFPTMNDIGSTGEQLCVQPKLLNQISALGHAVTSNHLQVVYIIFQDAQEPKSAHPLQSTTSVSFPLSFFSFRTYYYYLEPVWGP